MGKAMYVAFFEPDARGGPVDVTFPQFPGCVSQGDTWAEAYACAEEALALHFEGMAEDGVAIPAPAAPGTIDAPDMQTVFPVLVSAETPESAPDYARINTTLPKPLVERIDQAAGGNRSGWLADAAREKLQRDAGR